MRKALIGLGVVVGLLVLLAIVVPMLIPAETYRDRVVAAAEQATGREVRIDGPVKVAILPALAVEANGIALANAPGAATKDMVTASKLEIGLKLLPLISGDVEIDRFVLTDPVIQLEIDKQGTPNWRFSKKNAPPPNAPPAAATPEAQSQAVELSQLKLGKVELINGTITYQDDRTGKHDRVDKIGVKVKLPSLDDPSAVDGSLDWHGQTVTIALNLSRPRALLGDGQSTATASVSAEPIKLAFDGNLTAGTPMQTAGAVTIESPSLRRLAAWTGSPLAHGGGLGPFSLKGKIAAAGPRVALNAVTIALDAIHGTGDIALDTGGAVPAAKGRLDLDTLDLNPYLAHPAEAPATAPAAPGPPQGATSSGPAPAPKGWSDAPIDLSALKSADLDFALTTGALHYEKIALDKTALSVLLKGGHLTADLGQMALYGGSGKGRVTVDSTGPVPALDLAFDISGIDVQPLLAALIDQTRVSGKGALNFTLASRGRSQRELVSALNGNGRFAFSNGAVKGIDLGAMTRNVAQSFAQAALGGSQETKFSSLGGSFTVQSGIVKNSDLTLASDVVQLSGAGTVDLPQQQIDYRIEPKIGAATAGGVAVPILVQGPLSDPSYRPDLKGLLSQKLNPGQLLNGLTGSSGAGGTTASKPKPADVLKGLFGGK